jgi:hypothetical protein
MSNAEQAFPVADIGVHGTYGMSLRDYFAAQALPAMIAAYVEANGRCIGTDHLYSNIPAHAYRMADAMMKSRKS